MTASAREDAMEDFREALNDRLERNREIEQEREHARREMERIEEERAAEDERRRREQAEERRRQHTELVEHLKELVRHLDEAVPERVVARTGWTESGEEFIAKLTTAGLTPSRSLFIELDRDDDEVLARWTSDVGESIELWRLHEFDTARLSELVLQVVDEDLWRGRTETPPFPGQ